VVVSIGVSGDAVVAGGENCGCALEGELHPFVALALDVVDGEVLLALAVGDGDDGRWGVDAAFKRAFITACARVGVYWSC